MSVSPSVPVPTRVLEIQALFAQSRPAAVGNEGDAMIFGRMADEAMSSPRSPSQFSLSTSPPRTSVAGSVVDDQGLLREDLPFAEIFRSVGAQYGIQPSILAAVAKVESGFDPTAVSHAGAQGLMQFMPGTAAGMGVDSFDPASSIDGAARYLQENLRRFGSLELALAAYNAGPGAVEEHNGIPPFAETQAYVPKVMAAAGLTR